MSAWSPSLGATWLGQAGPGAAFRVWAPEAQDVTIVLEPTDGGAAEHSMQRGADGFFTATLASVETGDLYRYRVDGQGPFPDPASRFQPQGVHGPSQVVDPFAYRWKAGDWKGIALEDTILYELHVGTFTPTGTFRSAIEKLPAVRDLGITAIELMPVADFAGDRNWGYDGVALFAPARCYGAPDDLRALVDAAHGLGLAVFLDVVYNHFGPDGAYQGTFSRHYFSKAHRSPWGDGINLDGPWSGPVRGYFIENALRWIHEYRVDGLRLDATHAIVDDSPRHFLAELSSAVRASLAGSDRRVHLIAEDSGNLAHMAKPEAEGGWGLDGLWSDDFHHQMRRALAGDRDGYFADFDGSGASIAETARRGWFYCGQHAEFFGKPRGSDPTGLEYPSFVFFIQNHDQVGNRAFGDRLHHAIDLAAYRAATVLLLLLPETPLLFMGQEWAASTPFQYFTDHNEELGKLVTQGRRREFERFAAFSDPEKRETIPDPQALSTFEASRLIWQEREREPHASIQRLYRELLRLRRSEAAMRSPGRSAELDIRAYDNDVLLLRRKSGEARLLAVVRLRGAGRVDLSAEAELHSRLGEELLSTEDPRFASDPKPLALDASAGLVNFERPGAVLLKQ